MNFSKNKPKQWITIISIMILASPIIMLTAPAAAQTAQDMPVYLKVYAEPDPVGVGQDVFLSLFFTKPRARY